MSLRLQCKKHPRYDGKKEPRASCDGCQFVQELRVKMLNRAVTEFVVAKPESVEVGG